MNWKNSNFQIFYHIIGNCHTYTESLRVLYELRQDRSHAIKASIAESKRSEAKVLTSKAVLDDKSETVSQRLLAVCNIEEQNARHEIAQPCYEAALSELNFISQLISIIENLTPARTISDFQKIQPVENAFDLIIRAHTDIVISGSISPEIFNEARNSPFRSAIVESVTRLMQHLSSCSDEQRTAFMSLSKIEIFNISGLPDRINIEPMAFESLPYPNVELENCQFPKELPLKPINEIS